MTTPTPMMAQYLGLKAEAEDCLLFYRMGDFFELFFDDARIASQVLDIALTARGEHDGEKVPMCGVPVHAATAYLQRLIKAGHRVAIAEQTESPEAARTHTDFAWLARYGEDNRRLLAEGIKSGEFRKIGTTRWICMACYQRRQAELRNLKKNQRLAARIASKSK